MAIHGLPWTCAPGHPWISMDIHGQNEFDSPGTSRIYCIKMSSHQMSSNKPRSSKCRHFCFAFDTHNYYPSCREVGKGDDPCVTNEKPCNICSAFTEEQFIKIKHRRRYVRKQKVSDTSNTSKGDELDLLGDDMEAFSGSQTDLEGAAENLFSSPPCPP